MSNILPGISYPLGATVYPEGVNFSIFSKNATSVELLLFERENHQTPVEVIRLDPQRNKTFYYWHCFIPGLKSGQLYAYRMDGPFDPSQGLRFDRSKVLLDPYTRAVVSEGYSREAAIQPGDNCAHAMKSVVIDPRGYNWEGDKPLNLPYRKSVIYELHVGGFTRHPSSDLEPHMRGTYRGLIQKIPYLKELGVTAVELLPVQQFDIQDTPSDLPNYWGYAPIAFFAPHNAYGCTNDPEDIINEFRDMVKALHKNGIEVILDVVFNHTAEGNEDGPTLSFKGIENRAYYMLENDQQYYKNYSGTGNTINANQSIIRRMIRDCLRHWVSEMHIDGFRFDLASVLTRDEHGRTLESPPLLWEIESDPVLASTKIIAEAWDIEQYQLGKFVGDKWAEWNGRFRDDIRAFVKGDEGHIRHLAARLTGSHDLFVGTDRNPNRSINFITCHDGFSLYDLVSYNEKHNYDNLEQNRDGHNHNLSWNCGVEGPTSDEDINRLRDQQMKNFLTILMISQGTPMLSMGDEVGRSQGGNNNAYCQDNAISWFDWRQLETEAGLLDFTKRLIRFNLNTPYFQETRFWNSDETYVHWHGVELNQPDWSHHSRSLAFTLENASYDYQFHIMLNAYWKPLDFSLPPSHGKVWERWIDTSAEVELPETGEPVHGNRYLLAARSVALLALRR